MARMTAYDPSTTASYRIMRAIRRIVTTTDSAEHMGWAEDKLAQALMPDVAFVQDLVDEMTPKDPDYLLSTWLVKALLAWLQPKMVFMLGKRDMKIPSTCSQDSTLSKPIVTPSTSPLTKANIIAMNVLQDYNFRTDAAKKRLWTTSRFLRDGPCPAPNSPEAKAKTAAVTAALADLSYLQAHHPDPESLNNRPSEMELELHDWLQQMLEAIDDAEIVGYTEQDIAELMLQYLQNMAGFVDGHELSESEVTGLFVVKVWVEVSYYLAFGELP
ncbi:hypothetical protein ANO11243_077900 [Dothideomycetidae sp. 11243]|nr:hypothetical protein ANO11243_077900 [fungal sp. No.11243]